MLAITFCVFVLNLATVNDSKQIFTKDVRLGYMFWYDSRDAHAQFVSMPKRQVSSQTSTQWTLLISRRSKDLLLAACLDAAKLKIFFVSCKDD